MPSEIRLVPHYSRENRKQRRKLKIPSFPRRRESDLSGFGCFSFRNFVSRHSRAGGNLEFQCLKNLSEKTKTLPPSFPRKWESRNEKQQEFIGNDRN
ncbi:hypothetical protein [Neisseria gonorrhoeae]|uniref:hypothetical protein n=1 Tax=Neisseria gonorrhoeae TaxID=485 RepID=UPI0011DFE7B7|nr:hypothetical protein [Neisseria gonorrhoeae]